MKDGTQIRYKNSYLGTSIVQFHLPMELIGDINKAYDKNSKNLIPHNNQLAGKIADEKAIDEILTSDMKGIFQWCFQQYLIVNNLQALNPVLGQVWINEMKSNEYNPIHFHTSSKRSIKRRCACKRMVRIYWRRPITTFFVAKTSRCSSG